MHQAKKGFDISSLNYSEDSFDLLSQWLRLGVHGWEMNLTGILEKTTAINTNLTDFFPNLGGFIRRV